MHDGARGSGAPKANQNAFKHGLHTQDSKKILGIIQKFVDEQATFIKNIKRLDIKIST
jgi:hypothetical protein